MFECVLKYLSFILKFRPSVQLFHGTTRLCVSAHVAIPLLQLGFLHGKTAKPPSIPFRRSETNWWHTYTGRETVKRHGKTSWHCQSSFGRLPVSVYVSHQHLLAKRMVLHPSIMIWSSEVNLLLPVTLGFTCC